MLRRCTRNHFQIRDFGQARQNVLLDAIRNGGVGFIIAPTSNPKLADAFVRRTLTPASPQSITRLAMLSPAPARLARSFTSTTPPTGPLWIPIRSCRRECFLSAQLTSTAHCAGASGLV